MSDEGAPMKQRFGYAPRLLGHSSASGRSFPLELYWQPRHEAPVVTRCWTLSVARTHYCGVTQIATLERKRGPLPTAALCVD